MGCVASAEEVTTVELDIKDAGESSADGWKAYVDTQLLGGGCGGGMIVGLKEELWAKSDNLGLKSYKTTLLDDEGNSKPVDVNEVRDLVAFAKTGVKPDAGLRINGTKYMVIRSEQGGKDELPFLCYARHEKVGVCVVMVNSCIVIGSYDEGDAKAPTFAGACNTAVERLARYLLDNGF